MRLKCLIIRDWKEPIKNCWNITMISRVIVFSGGIQKTIKSIIAHCSMNKLCLQGCCWWWGNVKEWMVRDQGRLYRGVLSLLGFYATWKHSHPSCRKMLTQLIKISKYSQAHFTCISASWSAYAPYYQAPCARTRQQAKLLMPLLLELPIFCLLPAQLSVTLATCR